MKAINKGSLTIILLVFTVSAQVAMGNDIEKFFKRTHRSFKKHHKELVRAHVRATKTVVSARPKVRVKSSSRFVRKKGSHVNAPVRRSHKCRMIKVRVWVAGRYENSVEQRWVENWSDGWCSGGGYYENVTVRRWVSGHHKIVWKKDPNCYCRRGHGRKSCGRPHSRRSSDSYWR